MVSASAGGTIAFVLFIAALVSITRDSVLGSIAKVAWAFVLPFVGPILWFAVGKRYPYGVDGGNRRQFRATEEHG